MKSSYLFLADGFEEVEAICVIDIMRRASLPIKTISITDSLQVVGAHNVTLTADSLFADTDFSDADWLILPGGMPGATNLAKYTHLGELLVKHNKAHQNIAAICASPAVVLAPLGVLDNKNAVCYPGFEKMMTKAKLDYKPIVSDGNILTANGPAAAIQFALAIVAKSIGDDHAREIAEGLLLYEMHHEYYF